MQTRREITDDEVIEWWELYDAGVSIGAIAVQYRRNRGTIQKHLEDLGVFFTALEERIRSNTLYPREQRIRDALARIDPTLELQQDDPGDDSDVGFYKRHLPYAFALEHHVPESGHRRKHCQSSRQRDLEKMIGSRWGKVIRSDLSAAGLMGRNRFRMVRIDGYASGHYFY